MLRLCTLNKEECKTETHTAAVTLSLLQSPFSPCYFSFLMTVLCVTPKKEGESLLGFLLCVYRFLSSIRIAKPMTIAMTAALPNPITYVSVMGAGVGVGAGVGSGASSMLM